MTRKVAGLITSLTLWDVVAMNIVAVVGLRWISRSARLGAPSVTLWILACLVFFVPLAAVLAELSSRHPEQGGIYAWARRAFGPAHGFICGWCMWVNNLFYFPSLLLFAAANALVPLGADGAAIADSRLYSVTFVLGFVWLITFVNILGFSAGQVAAASRQRRDLDSRGHPDRRRRDRVRHLRQRHVVCAVAAGAAR